MIVRGIGSDQTEYSSKKYQNPLEANQRLLDILNALDGLESTEEDEMYTSIEQQKLQQQQTLGEGLIREGFLYKTNRDGLEKYYFILTSQYLSYCTEKLIPITTMTTMTTTTRLNHKRSIPLTSLLVKDANEDFKALKYSSPSESYEIKIKSFLIQSKEKSFHLTASSIVDRNEWFEDIQQAARLFSFLFFIYSFFALIFF